MPRFDVTTIGEGQLRYSVPAGERLELADTLSLRVAGTEANVSGLLSRLGWRCGWVSSLPDTPLGRRVRNEYRLAGLDLSAVCWSGNRRVATYYVEYALPPRATQVYYDRTDTCFLQMTPADVDWAYLLDTRLLHLSGLTLPLSSPVAELLSEAIRRANAAGVPVSFDMNYRARLWTPQEAQRLVTPLLNAIDVLFCSRSDARTVFGIEGTPREIVTQLGERSSAAHIVTSLSSDGLIGWDRHTYTEEPARAVQVLDRIGAGDAMVAGVLHGLLGGDFSRGIRLGALTAALALTQHGDQVVTTADELGALLDSTGQDIVR